MKICFISLNIVVPWGGSEELSYQTAKALKKAGHDISVIYPNWGNQQTRHIAELRQLGVHVHLVPFKNDLKAKFRRFLDPLIGGRDYVNLRNLFKKIKPDLVSHTTSSPRWENICDILPQLNIPYVVEVQMADEIVWQNISEAGVEYFKNAKGVYFLSDKNQIATEKQLGIRLQNAKRHYNPINVDPERKPNFNQDIVKFACVGRMGVPHKRQDLVLEVLAQPEWRDKPWELHFFGKGEDLNSLQRIAKMYNLDQKVFFRGHVSDINEIWSKCDALLLPSTCEGMSLAVLECMGAGRVPVVTNAGGNVEYIQDSVNGFIAEAPTLKLFSEALDRAWQRKNDWPEIGKRAQETLFAKVPPDAAEYYMNEILNAK